MSFSSPWLLRMNAATVSMARREAPLPALWPPTPSQTANRLWSVSTRRLSSLSLRRRPTSVRPCASSMEFRASGTASAGDAAVPCDVTPRSKDRGTARGWSTSACRCGSARTTRRDAPHPLDHLAHGALHADQDRAGHDAVADVELADLRLRGDRAHVLVGQPVAGVHGQAQPAPPPRRVHEAAQRRLARLGVARVGVGGGVELDRLRVELVRLLDLLQVGVDEEADLDAAVQQ